MLYTCEHGPDVFWDNVFGNEHINVMTTQDVSCSSFRHVWVGWWQPKQWLFWWKNSS